MDWLKSYRFLRRLNAPPAPAERQRVERVLGTARLLLSILSLVAVYIDPAEPSRYTRHAFEVLGIWVVYCLTVVLYLRLRPVGTRTIWLLHGMDVLWPTLMTLFSEGPTSPFFAFFVFALASAAFRWGFRETLATALLGVGLLDLEAMVLSNASASLQVSFAGQFDLNRLIIRGAYLMTLGVLIGYLGENEKERRAEIAAINRVVMAIRAEHRLATGLQTALTEFMQIYDGRKAYVIVHEIPSDRLFLWQTPSRPSTDLHPYVQEVPVNLAEEYLLDDYPQTFYCARDKKPGFITLKRDAELRNFPDLPFDASRSIRLLSTSSSLGNQWRARVILLDARLGSHEERELRFAENLFTQSSSSLYSVSLVRRLRSRAGAVERARVARELHDGAIQSLVSAEMQVDVLRRRAANADTSNMGDELSRIQQLLRQEVLNLRELMQQMKPVDMGPQQFLDFLADTVDRFRRDTGISAKFVSDLQDVEMSPKTCREIARIVQEGLVNVRKHARASNVLVQFTRDDGTWKLIIDDDGQGFNFNGRMSFEELVSRRKGPTVIKERVRSIGGELTVDSSPKRGARLEITLPQKGRTPHG